jgi:neutral ceramidase
VTWDLRNDSPLLDAAANDGRIRFSVTQPDGVTTPSGVGGVMAGSLLAGVAEVDITPPPGLPKAGYSANATDGQGFRTRLRARVLHLQRGPASMAIVQCDLLGGSAVLAHLVARHLADCTDIPLAGLMIGATHTHAGPGQFLGTDFYNRFASNRSGFDPAWAQFLAERIAGAAERAVATRVPARLAVGSTDVWGFTRNRSLDPHVRNQEVADKRLDPQRKWVNVDSLLHLVRVDTADGAPLAAMVVFGVHGTGISMKAPEYNADLWAYVVGELSHRIEQAAGTRAVVGAIEGTHADIAPAIRPGRAGHLEAQRIGRGIGAEAAALWERLADDLSGDVELGAGLHEVDLDRDRTIDGVSLPRRPAVGAALVAGAHENTTPVLHRLPPFRPGSPKPWRTRHPQGPKWVLGSRWLQPALLPLRGFPRIVPVQVLRIADTALVGLPFEVTTASGRRIAAAVSAATADAGIDRVVVSSVANEYAGYVATAEEYQRQHYEGGHTLYGPSTEPFVSAHAARVAAAVMNAGGAPVTHAAPTRSFDLKVAHYLPDRARVTVGEVPRVWDGDVVFADPDDIDDATWTAHWFDAAPGALDWSAPMVAVEVAPAPVPVWDTPGAGSGGGPKASVGEPAWQPAHTRDGRLANDQGWDLEVMHLGEVDARRHAVAPGTHRYRVRWHDPVLAAGLVHRFVLAPTAGRPGLAGPAFD